MAKNEGLSLMDTLSLMSTKNEGVKFNENEK